MANTWIISCINKDILQENGNLCQKKVQSSPHDKDDFRAKLVPQSSPWMTEVFEALCSLYVWKIRLVTTQISGQVLSILF